MTKRLIVIPAILITIILGSSLLASAQPQAAPQPAQQPGEDRQQMQPRTPPPGDPLGDSMFPPDLIMQNQRKLALTDDQKTYIQNEMQQAASRFSQLQWQLNDALEALHETLKVSPVNEQQALAQLNKVLDSEREIKTLQMGMQIRIKNKLTPEQQTTLQTIRNAEFRPGRDRKDRGGDGQGRPPRPPDGMRPGGPGGPGGPPGGGGGPRPGGRPGGPM